MTNNVKQNLEKEVKFIINKSTLFVDLIAFIEKLGLVLDHQDSQTDVYYDNSHYDIINLKRGLRVRYLSEVLTNFEFKSLFKGQNGFAVEEVRLLDDSKLNYSDLEKILVNRLNVCSRERFLKNEQNVSLERFLEGLELLPAITLKKDRRVYTDQEKKLEICVDSIKDLGIFVEIEAVDILSTLFDEMVTKFEQSGFAELDKTHAGYLDLMLSENPKILSKTDFEKKFLENPKWNVKPDEEEIFSHLTG